MNQFKPVTFDVCKPSINAKKSFDFLRNENPLNPEVMEGNKELLTRPIDELPVREEIKIVCSIRGFKNLGDLLEVSDYDMVHKLGFSYHGVIGLFGYLQSHGLGHLMENPRKKN